MGDILGELFAARGLARLQARSELETAWEAAVGGPTARQCRLGEVRRGVLNVTVAHPALLEELAAFRKPALLTALRQDAPSMVIHDIRFRVGRVDVDAPSDRGGGPRSRRPPGEPSGPR